MRAALAAALSVLAAAFFANPMPVQASASLSVGPGTTTSFVDGSTVHVVGEVQNGGSDAAHPVLVRCQLLDANGRSLAFDTAPGVSADILLAGEKSPFEVLFSSPPAFSSVSCSVSGASTTAVPNHNLTSAITRVTTDGDGLQHLTVTVTNNNGVPEADAHVMLTAYDTQHPPDVLDTFDTTVIGPIAAGATTTISDLVPDSANWSSAAGQWAALTEAPAPFAVVGSPIAFSPQVQNTTSAPQSIAITNNGTGDLHLGALSFQGPNGPDFGTANDACSGATVAPQTACSTGITFTPTTTSPESGTLLVGGDANNLPQSVSLTGTGLPRPAATLSAGSVSFAGVVLGSSASQAIQVNSVGLDPVQVTGASVDDTADYSVDLSACEAAVPVGQSCPLTISFHPQTAGALPGTLTVQENGRNNPLSATLSGTGLTPTAAASLGPSSLTFGDQLVSTTSGAQAVSLTSTGTAPLSNISPSASGDFSVSNNGCPSTLAVGAGCQIAVSFMPTAAGPRSGTLTVSDSAGTQTVSLSGNGTLNTTFYFAEGFTGPGFTETLSMLMPNRAGTATIEYQTASGSKVLQPIPLQAGKVVVESVNTDVGANQQVSARVTLSGPGVVERQIHFTFGAWHGSTDIVGVTAPSTDWSFAEGSTLAPFSEFLTLQNPNDAAVTVDLHYFTEGAGSLVKTLTLPGRSRTTVVVFAGNHAPSGSCDPGTTCGLGTGIQGVSVQVHSRSLPIVAERPMYVNGFSFGSGAIRDGHVAFGALAPALKWYFAEGTTLNGFNEYLTIMNPGSSTAHVTLTYQDESGHVTQRSLAVPPLSRATVPVFIATQNGVGPGVPGVSVVVTSSDQPIVVERPMYIVWNFGSGTVAGAHDVMGATALGQLFGFAAVSTASGEADFLTIQNPGPTNAQVTITYFTQQSGAIQRVIAVAANSRRTVPMFSGPNQDPGGLGPGYANVGLVVSSTQPILVEKPTYGATSASYGATDTAGYAPSAF